MTSPNTQTPPSTAAEVLDASVSPPTNPPLNDASKPAAAPAAPEKIASKLELLIQREKAAVERERAAKAKEAELSAKLQAFEDREAKLREFETVKKNPKKALELLGLSYHELTQAQLEADGQLTPEIKVRQLEEKLNDFEKNQELKRAKEEESRKLDEQRQSEKVIQNFKTEINSYLKENSARYELIEFEQSQDLVYDVIDTHYSRTLLAAQEKATAEGTDPEECRGEVLSIAQAADKVEAHLEQKYDKARNLSKVKSLLAPRPEKKPIPAAKPPIPPQRQMPKTLNNTMSATPAASRTRPITDEERVAKAIAYAKGLRPAA